MRGKHGMRMAEIDGVEDAVGPSDVPVKVQGEMLAHERDAGLLSRLTMW
jgi:hypothetical protein